MRSPSSRRTCASKRPRAVGTWIRWPAGSWSRSASRACEARSDVPPPIFYGANVLERSTVTAATTVTDRPVVRLSDRFVGPVWQGTGPIVWDQGPSPAGAFDAVIGAAGHDLAGATVTIQSDSSLSWSSPTTLGTLVIPAGTAAFVIPCAGVVERYSRLSVTGGPSPFQLGELYASLGVVAPQAPRYPSAPNAAGNYAGTLTETGVWVAYVKSAPLWRAAWEIPGFTRTQRDAFLDVFAAVGGGARPFYVQDDEGRLQWCRWVNAETAFSGLVPQEYVGQFQLVGVAA